MSWQFKYPPTKSEVRDYELAWVTINRGLRASWLGKDIRDRWGRRDFFGPLAWLPRCNDNPPGYFARAEAWCRLEDKGRKRVQRASILPETGDHTELRIYPKDSFDFGYGPDRARLNVVDSETEEWLATYFLHVDFKDGKMLVTHMVEGDIRQELQDAYGKLPERFKDIKIGERLSW